MDKVGDQLPTLAATVAGLILVFLGLVVSQWDGFEPTSKASVKKKFRLRGWSSFFGFLLSVLAGLLGLIGVGSSHKPIWPDVVGVIALGLAVGLMTWVAFLAIMDIER